MHQITVKEVEFVAHRMAQELLAYNEPIPDFSTRYPHRLEGCLAVPFLSFGGVSPYPSLADKASALFYLMIKNHPFQNGNKRVAMTTLLVFLHMNRKWLEVNPEELYQFTIWIAGSPSKANEASIQAIKKFVKDHLVDL